MTSHKATRDLNAAYPKGTRVAFFDECHAWRIGDVERAANGVLRIVSPPPPGRKARAVGLTRDLWEKIRQTYRVPRERIDRVL
jgi:hypothetical protein